MEHNPIPSEETTPSMLVDGAIADSEEESLLRRHKNAILTVAFLGAAALTFNELGPIEHDIEEAAKWTLPAIFTSESIATAGLAAMIASTGNKIGNPFTLRSRLKEQLKGLQQKLSGSPLYRTGAYLNLAGAAGTSGIIASETIKDLPVNSWPLGLGVAAMSTALSLPFYKIARKNSSKETN